MRVARDDLAYFDTRVPGWIVEGGEYAVQVGASSGDVRVSTSVTVAGDEVHFPVTAGSPISEALADPRVGPAVREALSGFLGAEGDDILSVIGSFPIGRLATFPGVNLSEQQLTTILAPEPSNPGAADG